METATTTAIETPTTETVEPTGAAPTESQQESAFTIPDDYKDAGWAQGLDSQEAVWKKLAGSQKLIGDRGAFIPQDNASDAEIEAFINRLDPISEKLQSKFAEKAPESYEFGEIELPEGVTIPEANTVKFKEIAKSLNLSNDKASELRKSWIEFEVQSAVQKEQALETEFEDMAKSLWGDDWTSTTAQASEVLRQNVPEEMRQQMMNMPNRYLVPLIATIKNMQKDAPDSIPTDSAAAHMDKDQLKEKYRELRTRAAKTGNPNDRKAFYDFNDKYRHEINK